MLRWGQISDEIMAYCDLKEDPMFSKIANKDIYIRGSVAIANKVASLYENKDLVGILRQHHVQINYHEDSKANDMLFSQIQSQIYYEKNRKIIDIFLPCIIEKIDALQAYGYEISLEELLKLHIAHEFYHFYEYEYNSRTYELLPKVDYRMLHVIHRKASVHRSSEIAAHRFAQVITKAQLHPKLMDYLYLIKKETYQENEVCEIISNIAETLQGDAQKAAQK